MVLEGCVVFCKKKRLYVKHKVVLFLTLWILSSYRFLQKEVSVNVEKKSCLVCLVANELFLCFI